MNKILVNSLTFYNFLQSIIKNVFDSQSWHNDDEIFFFDAGMEWKCIKSNVSEIVVDCEFQDFNEVRIKVGDLKRLKNVLQNINQQPLTVFFENGKIITTISI
jgi:hypothetical protein